MPIQVSPIPLFQLRTNPLFRAREPKLVPVALPGAQFSEFYCDPVAGSNLNSGHTTGTVYTSAGGNWANSTLVFTVTDGTNPSLSVVVGDFGSVYVTSGATQATFIGRVTAVQNAINGTVTFSAVFAGTNPSNGTGTITLKVGGPWKGPSGSQGSPITLASLGTNATNANGDLVRVNFKNNASYLPTSSVSAQSLLYIQGYASTVGDGGKATIDFGTSIAQWTVGSSSTYKDLDFTTSATSGSADLVVASSSNTPRFFRCVFRNARGNGIITNNSFLRECEVFGNNRSNTSLKAGVDATSGAHISWCFIHDNTGSNTSGVLHASSAILAISNTVISGNGKYGLHLANAGSSTGIEIDNTDFYANISHAIFAAQTTLNIIQNVIIQNCNFIANGGAAINNAENSSGAWVAGISYNCGYGAGTMANRASDTLGHIEQVGKITYANDVTPWLDPDNGDYSLTLAASISAGRGVFTETDPGLSAPNTIGFPDVGAAQAQTILAGWRGTTKQVLPDGYVGHSYSWIWGFPQPVTASVVSGSLPTGLTLYQIGPAAIEILGTPTVVGTYDFTLRITDGVTTADAPFEITILDDPDEGVSGVGGG